jgi:hypothetical protein
MKLLFSSSDRGMVERFGQALMQAGIRCEIRRDPDSMEFKGPAYYPELWIQNEMDFSTACSLFALRGLPG